MSARLYSDLIHIPVELEEEHVVEALGYQPAKDSDVLTMGDIEHLIEDHATSMESEVSDEVTRQMVTFEMDMKDLCQELISEELARNSLWSRLKRFLIRR